MNLPATFDNNTVQTELLSTEKEPYGFKVTVDFKVPFYGVKSQTYRNITEVHWKYDTFSFPSKIGVAVESYIHSTGYTHDVLDVASVLVEAEKNIQESI